MMANNTRPIASSPHWSGAPQTRIESKSEANPYLNDVNDTDPIISYVKTALKNGALLCSPPCHYTNIACPPEQLALLPESNLSPEEVDTELNDEGPNIPLEPVLCIVESSNKFNELGCL